MEYRRRGAALIVLISLLIILFSSAAAAPHRQSRPGKEQKKTDTAVSLIASQPEAVLPQIAGEEDGEIPVFSIGIRTMEGASVTCVWTVDGEEAGNGTVFSLDSCDDPSIGVHTVQCRVTCRLPDGTVLTEDSVPVSWIRCTGIIPNSVLTFSDVHGDYSHIGLAIGEIMEKNGGKIPALIICSGDWTGGSSATEQEDAEKIIPALRAQCGGIDTVFTAGNHDNRQAAVSANADAAPDTGDGAAFPGVADGLGTSDGTDGLAVFSIHFEDVIVRNQRGRKSCSYAGILEKLEAFLETQAAKTEKPLIIISSHTGLHALGIQPESSAKAWAGGSIYNVDQSDQVISLLNRYAEEYGLRILFLFGHNHSKGEKEFCLNTGDTIFSTSEYADRIRNIQELKFTYAHAGYLTDGSGGTKHYTFLTWDDETFSRVSEQIGSP